ncbi:hypothetical protein BH09ACT3_BH09ACT3_13440 [soil metagenome]
MERSPHNILEVASYLSDPQEVREYLLDNIDKIGQGSWRSTQFHQDVVVYGYLKYGVES